MSDKKHYIEQTRLVSYVNPNLKNQVNEYARQKETSVSNVIETALKNLITRDVKP